MHAGCVFTPLLHTPGAWGVCRKRVCQVRQLPGVWGFTAGSCPRGYLHTWKYGYAPDKNVWRGGRGNEAYPVWVLDVGVPLGALLGTQGCPLPRDTQSWRLPVEAQGTPGPLRTQRVRYFHIYPAEVYVLI